MTMTAFGFGSQRACQVDWRWQWRRLDWIAQKLSDDIAEKSRKLDCCLSCALVARRPWRLALGL